MENKKLFAQLRKKTGKTRQAFWYRAQRMMQKHQITKDDAYCVIAHDEGIQLARYLNVKTLDRIRGIIQQISTQTQTPVKSKPNQRGGREGRPRVVQIGKAFKLSDPILSDQKINEAKEMAEVYPLLYILENSIREVIDRILTSRYGKNEWLSHVKTKLREKVEGRMAEDKRNAWHQRRGARPIDYLDLNDLKHLMWKIEDKVVPEIIPDMDWFVRRINDAYLSRCVVCHMNPLDKVNIQDVKVKLAQWQKQVMDKNIP